MIRMIKKMTVKFPLSERNMAEIKMFDVNKNLKGSQEILDHFELAYELEYKYHALRNNDFSGSPQRYDNTLNIIEEKAKEVIIPLAKTFIEVFETWLEFHALTSANSWAKARYKETKDYGEMEEIFGGLLSEWARYYYGTLPNNIDNVFNEFLEELSLNLFEMPNLSEILKEYLTTVQIERAQIELEDVKEGYTTLDEWNDNYDLEAKDIDEAWDLSGDIEVDVDDIYLPDYIFSKDEFVNLLNEDAIVDMYEIMVFPMWFGHWEKEGIVETRKNVEKVTRDIKSIKNQDLQKQFLNLNIATNLSHQTGSMMNYYEERYGVSADDLKALSDTDVREWNKDLQEIGVRI